MRATAVVARSVLLVWTLAAFIVAGIGAPGTAGAQPATQRAATTPRAASGAQVILFKGLAGIFSSGMIDLGEKLTRHGIANRVESQADSVAVTEEIVARYRGGARGPIILVGHSLGADAAGGTARRLNDQGIPVALLVTFSPWQDAQVTPNVAQAINYYQTMSGWRGRLVAAPGFHGSLSNIDLDGASGVNHFNIEKDDRLHQETIAKISAALGRTHAKTQAPSPTGRN